VAEQASYSGTPLAKKLGIKDGGVLALVGVPPKWSVPDLPAGVTVVRKSRQRARLVDVDVALVFCRTAADMADVPLLVESLPKQGTLWVAWPRKAGGHVSDISDNLLRDALLPTGVVDVKVAAVDADWSGLKFVWRKENR
jgi:hypothetical protein